jgi:hypothetical protein
MASLATRRAHCSSCQTERKVDSQGRCWECMLPIAASLVDEPKTITLLPQPNTYRARGRAAPIHRPSFGVAGADPDAPTDDPPDQELDVPTYDPTRDPDDDLPLGHDDPTPHLGDHADDGGVIVGTTPTGDTTIAYPIDPPPPAPNPPQTGHAEPRGARHAGAGEVERQPRRSKLHVDGKPGKPTGRPCRSCGDREARWSHATLSGLCEVCAEPVRAALKVQAGLAGKRGQELRRQRRSPADAARDDSVEAAARAEIEARSAPVPVKQVFGPASTPWDEERPRVALVAVDRRPVPAAVDASPADANGAASGEMEQRVLGLVELARRVDRARAAFDAATRVLDAAEKELAVAVDKLTWSTEVEPS